MQRILYSLLAGYFLYYALFFTALRAILQALGSGGFEWADLRGLFLEGALFGVAMTGFEHYNRRVLRLPASARRPALDLIQRLGYTEDTGRRRELRYFRSQARVRLLRTLDLFWRDAEDGSIELLVPRSQQKQFDALR